MATAPADVWARKYLTDKGYKDDQIGYDPGRGMVTADGMDFFKAPSVKGKAMGSMGDLDAAFGTLQQNVGTKKSSDLMSTLEEALGKPFEMQQFSFNPETDPRFLEAMKVADQSAIQGTGNVLANLASRGIENGSIMGDRAAQIQQQERGKVTGQLVPQLYAQAYDQFANEQSMKYKANQDQLSGLANLLGVQNNQNQQGSDNQFRDKTFNQGVAEADRAFEYTAGRDKVKDEQWKTEFNRIAKQDGIQNALAWAQNSISQQNANTSSASQSNSAANSNIDNLMASFKATGIAPAGLESIGINKGDKLPAEKTTPTGGSQTGGFNLDDYKGYINSNYFKKDAYGNSTFDSVGARNYILSLFPGDTPEDDAKTDEMLRLYGLPTN